MAGRIVLINEDDGSGGEKREVIFGGRLIKQPSVNPRSLLKPSKSAVLPNDDPLVLFCSECESRHPSMTSLRQHAARQHKGSRFFSLPRWNRHSDCTHCSAMMCRYEEMVASQDEGLDVLFRCPHCCRRFLGRDLTGLFSHLERDHRNGKESVFKEGATNHVLLWGDPIALQCDFCEMECSDVPSFNCHLINCSKNNTGVSAGLFCWVCGKMFALGRHLRDHLLRHGKDKLERPRKFACKHCPVACITEDRLNDHVEREHCRKDLDEGFVLHKDCQRCQSLQTSYFLNKERGDAKIPDRDLAFKCPHCKVLLFAHPVHAPRYLSNHVAKFHSDPDINDFTLGESSSFVVLRKSDPMTMRCDFCGRECENRFDHNDHLSSCEANDSPCRPGYMCNTCGYIGATSRHLRHHLESRHGREEGRSRHACKKCSYVGASSLPCLDSRWCRKCLEVAPM